MGQRQNTTEDGPLDSSWQAIPTLERTPHANHCGPFYYKKDDDGKVTMGWRVRPYNTNAMGFAHGGALMTFADFSLASAGMRHSKDRVVTVQFESYFVNAAPEGSWIESHLSLVRKGSLCFIKGELRARKRMILQFNGITKNLDPVAGKQATAID